MQFIFTINDQTFEAFEAPKPDIYVNGKLCREFEVYRKTEQGNEYRALVRAPLRAKGGMKARVIETIKRRETSDLEAID